MKVSLACGGQVVSPVINHLSALETGAPSAVGPSTSSGFADTMSVLRGKSSLPTGVETAGPQKVNDDDDGDDDGGDDGPGLSNWMDKIIDAVRDLLWNPLGIENYGDGSPEIPDGGGETPAS